MLWAQNLEDFFRSTSATNAVKKLHCISIVWIKCCAISLLLTPVWIMCSDVCYSGIVGTIDDIGIVVSVNRTPGSRSYSDLVDGWAALYWVINWLLITALLECQSQHPSTAYWISLYCLRVMNIWSSLPVMFCGWSICPMDALSTLVGLFECSSAGCSPLLCSCLHMGV